MLYDVTLNRFHSIGRLGAGAESEEDCGCELLSAIIDNLKVMSI